MAKTDSALHGTESVDTSTGEIVEYKFDPSTVKTLKLVNLPVLSQRNKGSIYVFFLGAMHVGKVVNEEVGKDGKKRGPATIAHVVDLTTGAPAQIIISTVQAGVLRESYPSDSYVDKSFHLENLGKLNGKEYNSVNVSEIETPQGIDISALKAMITTS